MKSAMKLMILSREIKMNKKKEKIIKCPNCDKKFNYFNSESRPFCSEKCKMVDLGLWLTENYSIPGEEKNNFDDQEDGEHGQE